MSIQPLDAVSAWYQQLSPDHLEAMDAYYREDVYFKDPFHEFAGRAQLQNLYERMFERLEAPRFVVDERCGDPTQGMLVWRFYFGLGERPYCLRGVTHLRFAGDGRVTYHHDYWDAAEQIYERIPLLGSVLRMVKKRVG